MTAIARPVSGARRPAVAAAAAGALIMLELVLGDSGCTPDKFDGARLSEPAASTTIRNPIPDRPVCRIGTPCVIAKTPRASTR